MFLREKQNFLCRWSLLFHKKGCAPTKPSKQFCRISLATWIAFGSKIKDLSRKIKLPMCRHFSSSWNRPKVSPRILRIGGIFHGFALVKKNYEYNPKETKNPWQERNHRSSYSPNPNPFLFDTVSFRHRLVGFGGLGHTDKRQGRIDMPSTHS